MQPDVRDLERPPPEILLPPGVRGVPFSASPLLSTDAQTPPTQTSCTSSPTANAHYSYQRCTVNAMPTNAALLGKSKLPLALVITPYRSLKEGDVSRAPLRPAAASAPAHSSRPAGARPSRDRHGDRALPPLPHVHQPLRDLYRGRRALEVLHVQPPQRGPAAV